MLNGVPRVTAVFATNPMTALGIMRRAQEREISIPRDLSVIGMDDSDIRMHVWPRLTAVCQDASALGYDAAVWLSHRLSKPPARTESLRRTLATVFEVNGTTAPPPAASVAPAAPSIASDEVIFPKKSVSRARPRGIDR
jgi:LacI family transcriptional regulator